MNGKQISLLIVDDSAVSSQLLSYMVQSDPSIKLIGSVSGGIEALKFLETQTPDVILMDINMPVMNGFEATRRIMSRNPIPIIICSGEYKSQDIQMSFLAIEAGALAILEKPKSPGDPSFEASLEEYIRTIKTVSEVKLITRLISKEPLNPSQKFIKEVLKEEPRLRAVEAVGIGASLGGPQALKELLSQLKKTFRVPIFIVQHITPGFADGFVSWLNLEATLSVRLAKHMEVAAAGAVYIAPSERQMEIHPGNIIKLVPCEKGGVIVPSISHLFKSMSAAYKDKMVGVILTGMGRDGVEELLHMKQQGAVTIAQDQEDCLMYGMPREAINCGAASHVFHIRDIAPFLNQI